MNEFVACVSVLDPSRFSNLKTKFKILKSKLNLKPKPNLKIIKSKLNLKSKPNLKLKMKRRRTGKKDQCKLAKRVGECVSI